jgi:hypothetical protein
LPSIVGTNFCEMMARSVLDKRCCTSAFSCGWNIDRMRSIDSAALAVCSVENTRWPVSAACRQIAIVSWSRNSPRE